MPRQRSFGTPSSGIRSVDAPGLQPGEPLPWPPVLVQLLSSEDVRLQHLHRLESVSGVIRDVIPRRTSRTQCRICAGGYCRFDIIGQLRRPRWSSFGSRSAWRTLWSRVLNLRNQRCILTGGLETQPSWSVLVVIGRRSTGDPFRSGWRLLQSFLWTLQSISS